MWINRFSPFELCIYHAPILRQAPFYTLGIYGCTNICKMQDLRNGVKHLALLPLLHVLIVAPEYPQKPPPRFAGEQAQSCGHSCSLGQPYDSFSSWALAEAVVLLLHRGVRAFCKEEVSFACLLLPGVTRCDPMGRRMTSSSLAWATE